MAMSGVLHRMSTCVAAQPAALNAAGSYLGIQTLARNNDLSYYKHHTSKRWSSKSTAEKR